MNIWAHRGCSQCYPENTITALEKAMNIPGLTGIELDIQLTKDGELVVIHDERVDRTTDGIGFVRDYTLTELKTLHIHTGKEIPEYIPTMREVLELLATKLKTNSIRLNIELKNSIYPYPGMEEKIVALVNEYGVADSIVYSSFYARSLMIVHELAPNAEIGVLDGKLSNSLYKAFGMESIWSSSCHPELCAAGGTREGSTVQNNKIALHPSGNGLDLSPDAIEGRTVRAYFGGHLYPEKPTGGKMNLDRLEAAGVTDVFLNEPERYIK